MVHCRQVLFPWKIYMQLLVIHVTVAAAAAAAAAFAAAAVGASSP
jgi:hypothetical protein